MRKLRRELERGGACGSVKQEHGNSQCGISPLRRKGVLSVEMTVVVMRKKVDPFPFVLLGARMTSSRGGRCFKLREQFAGLAEENVGLR